MYKAVVIGCGGRAPAHIEAYKGVNNVKVVACCAPSASRRDPLARKYGLKAYDDAETMIKQEKPDIVHIITWPSLRVELMTLVSDLGVPLCTVEKPVAMGTNDWRKLVQLEALTKTKFAVCHQVRWQPYLEKCKEAISNDKIGKVEFLHISACMNISGQGTHTLNYGMFLNNESPVTRVFANASGWNSKDIKHQAPETTEACLVFENGVNALWTSGNISPVCGDPSNISKHVRIAAYADKGRVLFEEFGKWEIVTLNGMENGDYGGMDIWKENNLIAQTGFHKAMFKWHEHNVVPGTNLKQSLHEWAVVLAVYQSALERRPVNIEDFDPPDDLVEITKSIFA